MLDIITAEESVFAQQAAREDFIKSQGTTIIIEEDVKPQQNYTELPICMDFDRFAKHLRNE